MIDPLLYEYGVTITLIKEKVSAVMEVDPEMMITPSFTPGVKKREFSTARQISMALSKKYTKASLASIGSAHGGRDHATVLNACKIVNNSLDTNDPIVTIPYLRSIKSIENFIDIQKKMKNNIQEYSIFNTEK